MENTRTQRIYSYVNQEFPELFDTALNYWMDVQTSIVRSRLVIFLNLKHFMKLQFPEAEA